MEATNSVTSPVFDATANSLGENLLRFNKKQKFFMFDTETCHLNLVSKGNVPWEYAWIICTQDEVLEKKQFLVNWPEINISDEAARVTGYYQKMHRIPIEGVDPLDMIKQFDERMYDEDLIPVAHNGLGFDIYMHNIHRKLVGLPTDYSYIRRFLDTNPVARAMKLQIPMPKDGKDLISFQYMLNRHIVRGVKTSIKALCTSEFGFDYDETRAHDAMYDVEKLQEITFKLIKQVELPKWS